MTLTAQDLEQIAGLIRAGIQSGNIELKAEISTMMDTKLAPLINQVNQHEAAITSLSITTAAQGNSLTNLSHFAAKSFEDAEKLDFLGSVHSQVELVAKDVKKWNANGSRETDCWLKFGILECYITVSTVFHIPGHI